MKGWFHNIKEVVVDWFSDQRDYIVYQKKYWNRSNFFIFLNWLSRGWLEYRIGRCIQHMHTAEKYIEWALNEEIADRPDMIRWHAENALKHLKLAEEAKEEIFKL